MKKIILLLFLSVKILYSVEIIHDGNKITISYADLKNYRQVEYHTTREKHGKIKNDVWKGIYLKDALNKVIASYYASVKFTSQDNYMIRLTKKEIQDTKPIIAFEKNGKKLPENKIRIISPELKDMYWIKGVNKIETEDEYSIIPRWVTFLGNYADKLKFNESLPPFIKSKGYYFKDIAANVFSKDTNEYIIVGQDGMLKRLDYEKYLSKAILEYDNGKYFLKSPQMPAGMWIKNIVLIQAKNKALAFMIDELSPKDIIDFLKIKEIPPNVRVSGKNKHIIIPSDTKFSDKSWKEATEFFFVY